MGRCLRCMEVCLFDVLLRGDVLVPLGSLLIGGVAACFFATVTPWVLATFGPLGRAFHLFLSLWLLFNVAYNYIMAVRLDPGSTRDLSLEQWARVAQTGPGWRFCHACQLPKPPLTHHCGACGRCVLRSDHHCPWLNNCVGHQTYRHFYLVLLWLPLGGAYAAVMFLAAMASEQLGPWLRPPLSETLLVCCVLLGLCVGGACLLLLAWHTFYVATAQGTIDWTQGLKRAREAAAAGRNPFDRGWAENWQERFDVRGLRCWQLRWVLPPFRRKRGFLGLPDIPGAPWLQQQQPGRQGAAAAGAERV